MQVDALILGGGVAGLLLGRALRARGSSVLVANDPARPAAAGLLNPVLGQRCTLAWQAAAALAAARSAYRAIERESGIGLFRDLPIVRVLRDDAERAAWSAHAPIIAAAGFEIVHAAILPPGFRSAGRGNAVAIRGAGLVDAWTLLDVLRRQLSADGAFVDHPCRPDDIALLGARNLDRGRCRRAHAHPCRRSNRRRAWRVCHSLRDKRPGASAAAQRWLLDLRDHAGTRRG